MALNFTGVATAIAGLSVSGVRMLNLTDIPTALAQRDAPAMFPKPDGFLGEVAVQVDSFGSGSGKKTVTYVLTYTFAHSAVGSERGMFALYQDMVAKVAAILDAFIANDAIGGAAIDVTPSAGVFGPVLDPSGSPFHGCEITVAVMEFVN